MLFRLSLPPSHPCPTAPCRPHHMTPHCRGQRRQRLAPDFQVKGCGLHYFHTHQPSNHVTTWNCNLRGLVGVCPNLSQCQRRVMECCQRLGCRQSLSDLLMCVALAAANGYLWIRGGNSNSLTAPQPCAPIPRLNDNVSTVLRLFGCPRLSVLPC